MRSHCLHDRAISRRRILLGSGTALAAMLIPRPISLFAQSEPASSRPSLSNNNQRYKIAACDWMLLKRQKLGAFKLAHDCGLDGLLVDMGPLGNRPDIENELRKD